VGGHNLKWSLSLHITCRCPNAQAEPEKSLWVVKTPSGLQVFTLLVGVRIPKLDPEKSQWVVTTPSGVQVFTSLASVRTPKLDPEKSQWKVRLTSDFSR